MRVHVPLASAAMIVWALLGVKMFLLSDPIMELPGGVQERITIQLKAVAQDNFSTLANGKTLTALRISQPGNAVLLTGDGDPGDLRLSGIQAGMTLSSGPMLISILEVVDAVNGAVRVGNPVVNDAAGSAGNDYANLNDVPSAIDIALVKSPDAPASGDAAISADFNTAQWAMTFKPNVSGILTGVTLMLRHTGSCDKSYQFSIREVNSSGEPLDQTLTTGGLHSSALPGEFGEYRFDFDDAPRLEQGKSYAAVLTLTESQRGDDKNCFLAWKGLDESYPDGTNLYNNGGTLWTPHSRDLYLKTHMTNMAADYVKMPLQSLDASAPLTKGSIHVIGGIFAFRNTPDGLTLNRLATGVHYQANWEGKDASLAASDAALTPESAIETWLMPVTSQVNGRLETVDLLLKKSGPQNLVYQFRIWDSLPSPGVQPLYDSFVNALSLGALFQPFEFKIQPGLSIVEGQTYFLSLSKPSDAPEETGSSIYWKGVYSESKQEQSYYSYDGENWKGFNRSLSAKISVRLEKALEGFFTLVFAAPVDLGNWSHVRLEAMVRHPQSTRVFVSIHARDDSSKDDVWAIPLANGGGLRPIIRKRAEQFLIRGQGDEWLNTAGGEAEAISHAVRISGANRLTLDQFNSLSPADWDLIRARLNGEKLRIAFTIHNDGVQSVPVLPQSVQLIGYRDLSTK